MTHYRAAKVALGCTVVLALTLVAMSALDARWLGYVAMVLLLVVLAARQMAVTGVRGFMLLAGGLALLGLVAFAVTLTNV